MRDNTNKVIGLLLVAFIFCVGLSVPGKTQNMSHGQTVYVPIYSSIIYGITSDKGDAGAIPFANILAIRNIDITRSIVIRSVKYYDADGNFLREERSAQRALGPLASTNVFVPPNDTTAGLGGSFIVEWESDVQVNLPIIEGINIYSLGVKMATFSSRGQPIQK
jgi:uncharacterized protein DUF3124